MHKYLLNKNMYKFFLLKLTENLKYKQKANTKY